MNLYYLEESYQFIAKIENIDNINKKEKKIGLLYDDIFAEIVS